MQLTCDGMSVAARFTAGDEDNIPLVRIGVFVLEEEEVVDAVVAESRGLDHDAEWPGKLLFNHKVLLAANLGAHRLSVSAVSQRNAGANWGAFTAQR